MGEAPDQRLLEQYHAAIQAYIFEGSAFWTRITVFVLLNSALLVALSALPTGGSEQWVHAGIALLGVIVTLLWAHSAVRSHFLLDFWLAILCELELALNSDACGDFTRRDQFLAGQPLSFSHGVVLRLPWIARGTVNDTTSGVLTAVFLAIWSVAIARLV